MADRTPSPEKAAGGKPHIKWGDAYSKGRTAVESLSTILRYFPPRLSSSETPAMDLLQDPDIATQISALLRRPDSGAVNDNLCAWLYDTFHSSEPQLQLVVLRFLPIIAGVYLTRAALNKPLPGFESVLLAIYAHETAARNGQAVTVSIPDLSHASIYHESKMPTKNASTELHLAVITASLEPHGTVRSTRRAKIVGVALELYYSKISQFPVGSKLDFCDFCKIWSGQNSHDNHEKSTEARRGRINLAWELLQPIMRILGHCLFRPEKSDELFQAAFVACRCLNSRAQHDTNAKAMLATGSLVKLAEMAKNPASNVDHTEIAMSNEISV
ncbi:hyccin [Perilla frutescens var. hirtella]|nr:hyccin [Perilla frutescens var. hirtella]